MIWHILKKDWRLLWGFIVMVAALQAIAEFALAKARLSDENPMLELMAQTLPILAFFAATFLIVAIVHLDAIPGLRQDWLVRPIRRLDLLVEKLLFIVVAVEGPIFTVNLAMGLASGFSLRATLLVAVERVIYLLLFLILPIFAFASVTKNMTEAFILGCVCAFIMGAFLTVADYANSAANGTLESIAHTGIGWIGELFRFAIVLIAAALILRFQYFFRKTLFSRALVVVFGTILMATVFLPWKPAFAMEERLSPNPAAATNLSLAFNPQVGRYPEPSGLGGNGYFDYGRNTEVFVPLRISGMHAGQAIVTDHGELKLFDTAGKLLYHGSTIGVEVEHTGSDPTGESRHQRISLPSSLYKELENKPVRAELEYSFTLFDLSKSYAIPAIGGDERMPGIGWCKTNVNDAGTAIKLNCIAAGNGPVCGSVTLENSSQGTQNPERFWCWPEYSPYSARPLADAFARFKIVVPFRDPSGLAKYPVDGPQLPHSQLVIRDDEPQAHFTRSLVIPQLKLGDWMPR
ncbi:MAG TPA: hypothetical protein VJR23_17265 [Candidatus Acidoferrales bacterium]|nr:hypothetical protein [Candidatus Acidoferrales bacterium]